MADTVLIAGGSEEFRSSLSRAVRSAGLEVCTAARGRDVPELVRHRHIDLIMMESGLPAGESFPVIETLRSRGVSIVCATHDRDISAALDAREISIVNERS